MMRGSFSATLLIAASLAAHPAAAETLRFGPRLPGWVAVQFPGIAPAYFTAADDATLNIATDSSAGILWRPLSTKAKTARWRWRVDEGVAATDLTRRGADDRAIGVYFVFSRQPTAGATPLAILAASGVTALVYLFGGDRPRGTVIASPHMGGRGKFIALRAAAAPKRVWYDENVDLAADYARAFGRAMPTLIGVAISSDSDDTRARNRARVQAMVVE
ncbi:MAG: DUF3047 domain-containing protein [Betaproteobacteria bacterium]|nr:DUF3047 domain-containing protein [Betaproteobacteria bacterium]